MKRISLSLAALFALSACDQMANPFSPSYSHTAQQQAAAQRQAPAQNPGAASVPGSNTGAFASDQGGCSARAESRMQLYDRPSTYPISDSERHDAFMALYSECMREHDWAVAGPVHTTPPVTNVASASSLANLSPAAGGANPGATTVNANGTYVTSSNVPGATVVVVGGANGANTASQLSSLSPSAGGTPQNATVVLVQSPQAAAAPLPGAYYSAAPLPVATPIAPPPAVQGYAPVARPIPPVASATPTGSRYYQRTPGAQPSLASADASLAGNGYGGAAYGSQPVPSVPAQTTANAQLENVLDK